jgi:glycosyltransferase involved in cell wall biosynthesis
MSYRGRDEHGNVLHAADLVVLSHLRWNWVWQRPQHLISRLSQGRRAIFVEEPLVGDVPGPTIRVEREANLERVWLEVPEPPEGEVEYAAYDGRHYTGAIQALLGERPRDVWLYTPTALPICESLHPRMMAYDVMDDLSSFADASPEMELLTRRALTLADIVFAGGRSLYRVAAASRDSRDTHLFPSGVETGHYRRSRSLRCPRDRPVAGYVGVIDERIDMRLVGELAERLPDWDIQLVGPTTKIDPRTIPEADNIKCPGQQPYELLPEIMAGFDVALMPFALNKATRSISPTKTLEYLAAGLPVVSTRVPDVVSDWSSVVHLADEAAGFADGCRAVRHDPVQERDRRLEPLLKRYEWDAIAGEIRTLLTQRLLSVQAKAA